MDPIAAHITRDTVEVAGPEALSYLQGQLSQDLDRLAPGEVAWSLVLQPQGKVDAWVRVHRFGHEELRLDVDAGAGPALLARLQRFKLRTKADLTLAEGVDALAVRGADLDGGLPCGWPGMAGGDVLAVGGVTLPEVPAGVTEVPVEAYEALRIATGVPRHGAELTEATIPAEVGQWFVDLSVSFTKGCYTGQELVARVDSRGGNVAHHLRGVVGAGVAVGAEVVAGEKSVGTVTSAAVDAAGRRIGLAFVHRSVEPPAEVLVAGGPGQVVALPLT